MKRDFSQNFKTEPSNIFLLIEDQKTSKFLVVSDIDKDEDNDGYYSEENYFIPYLDVDRDKDKVLQITQFLDKLGVAVGYFEELVRQTHVAYSFVDNTPGSTFNTVCMYVRAEAVESNAETRLATLAEIKGLVEHMPPIVEDGIQQLEARSRIR